MIFLQGLVKSLGNFTYDSSRIAYKLLVQSFPLLAIPIFLVASFTSIVLNDTLWGSAMEGVQFVQNSGGGAKGGFLSVYGKMNYFFPISESVLMIATLIPLKVGCLVFRIVRSFIPLIGG